MALLRRRHAPAVDPGLQQIADLEATIIRAHDEKVTLGASAEEVARFRPAVVAQARAVCDRLRAEHLARMGAS